MSNNTAKSGSAHIRALMNAAIESETGIVLRDLERGRAIYIRGQIHSLRKADRHNSKRLYNPEDPEFGTSIFDILTTEIQTNGDRCDLRIIRSDQLTQELNVLDEKTGEKIDLGKFL